MFLNRLRKNKIKTIEIDSAIKVSNAIWIDVRCNREYNKGHYTKSKNIPLFSDIEFDHLGKVYKKYGKKKAIKIGYEFILKSKLNTLKQISNYKESKLFIYCARGGLRSRAFYYLLFENNYDSQIINNGYKAIRGSVFDSFYERKRIMLIGGYTGSNKTLIINQMSKNNINTINLEKLANHKGSAFGDLGIESQATQQQFENDLSYYWLRLKKNKTVFIESESRTIGKVVIPEQIWHQMNNSFYLRINMRIERRIENLISEYGNFSSEQLKIRLERISNKLGDKNYKIALKYIKNGDLVELCNLLLNNYYDKMYNYSVNKRKTKISELNVKDESIMEIISLITIFDNFKIKT
ncbi:MAG: tRNA 2-selenouridine(34) synthase MnmH [Candidatus Marinimicrobia bacterium]|nr:tRNA 2-selenouridine(34) synthase MnmH [Candidatus Neomarinimicrobiota bacterium]|tara:strand:+ start:241 stop:1296 length:1056 start_codon:yes stop_codon:yes gene_type:complete